MDRPLPTLSLSTLLFGAIRTLSILVLNAEKLGSDLKYGWLVTVDSWKELISLRNGLKNAGRDFFAFTDPVQHYLTATGRTLFKELPFEELKRVQIEVLSFRQRSRGGRG